MGFDRIARMTVFVGVLLTSIGFLPAYFIGTFAPAFYGVTLELLFLLAAPLGVLVLAVGLIMWAISFFMTRWKK